MNKKKLNRIRLVRGEFHDVIVSIDARANETMLVDTHTRLVSHYVKNPENKDEFILKRTAHVSECNERERISPDDCCKCGEPQLGCGSEFCFFPLDMDVSFRICRPCLDGLDSQEHDKLRDRLLNQAILIVGKRVAEAN